MKNMINWFEIPSTDFDRAIQFYNTVFAVQLHTEVIANIPNAIFPGAEDAVRGSVVFDPNSKPSTSGAVVYLNADHQLDAILKRVESAGGKVLLGSTDIGFGSIAMILDTEGNKIGLHTEN